jgi:hypothetical protein
VRRDSTARAGCLQLALCHAPAILAGDPTVALYVAAILARRLDAANRWLVAVKRQLQTGEPPSVIGKAVEKVEELLSYGGRDPTGW